MFSSIVKREINKMTLFHRFFALVRQWFECVLGY